MKRLALLALFVACGHSATYPITDPRRQCGDPPSDFAPSEGPDDRGYLIDCEQLRGHRCCGYGFLISHQQVCFHMACQENCGPWEFQGSYCPSDQPLFETEDIECRDNREIPWPEPT